MSREALLAALMARPRLGMITRLTCPWCPGRYGKPDKKLSLRYDRLDQTYFCFRCHVSGRLLSAENLEIPQPVPRAEKTVPPENFIPANMFLQNSLVGEEAYDYLRRRVSPSMWKTLGIGVCLRGRYAGRIVLPVLNAFGDWLGWVGRCWRPTDNPYIYPPGMKRGKLLYNEAILDSKSDYPLLVVEGVFDAIHLWPHAVATLGKPAHDQLARLFACRRPVVFVPDGDAYEEGWALSVDFRLRGKQTGAVRLPPKKDPDEFPAHVILSSAIESLRQAV